MTATTETQTPAEETPETSETAVSFSEPEFTGDTGFEDVDKDHWAAQAVFFAVQNGLFNGTGNGKFSPDMPMTRAMLMTVLARVNGADTQGNALEKGMAWAVEQGISDGSSPDGNITREQIVTMLYRNAGQPDVSADSSLLSGYTDGGSISDYAEKAMIWAHDNGIINGMGDGTLAPGAGATRAQVAQMMYNYIKKCLM